jgi:hypothetical protein
MKNKFKLLFSNPASLSKGDFDDSMRRGYRGDILIEINGIDYYELSFWDLVNVGYEINESEPFFYFNPNLILLKEVSYEEMLRVCEILVNQDWYFKMRKKYPKSKVKKFAEVQE